MQFLNRIKQLDAFPKINEDFYSRSLSGGIITLVSSIAMLLLFLTELRLFLNPVMKTQLIVDTSRGETLKIYLDVTFPSLACSIISLDAMDISGEQHLDVKHNIFKKRLDSTGKAVEPPKQENIGGPQIGKPLQRHGGLLEHNETYCGSCFGAEQMDKASIVADAISHVQALQKQVKLMQDEILTLEANEVATPEALSSCSIDSMEAHSNIQDDLPQHKIIELDVSNMEPSMYHLRIHCKKGPGVLVQLTKALEPLNFEIVNANFITVNDHILNTIVIKVKSDEMWRPEDLKQMMVQIFPMFGLTL